MQGELSVAITGQDTLSPALAATNRRLAETKAAMENAATEADFLRDRFARLKQQHDLGLVSATKFSGELRTLKADMASLAATTNLGAEASALLANTGRQVEAQLRRVDGGMNRAVFGMQALSLALDNGRISASGLSAALTTIGLSSVGGVLAGLAAIGTAIGLITQASHNAKSAFDEMRNSLRSIPIAELEGRLSLARHERDRVFGPGEPSAVARIGFRVNIGGVSYSYKELTSYIEALQRQIIQTQFPADPPGAPATRTPRAPRDSTRGLSAYQNALAAEGRVAGREGILAQITRERRERFTADWAGLDAIPLFEKMGTIVEKLPDKFDKVTKAINSFSDAFATGFGAAIDAAASGGHVFESFTNAVLGALSREARGKAVFEAAEGFAALARGLLFGDPKAMASAGAHFKAAALFGGASAVTGALAGGGGSANRSATTANGVSPNGARGPINIIQFVTADGRQVSQYVVDTAARQQRLGASVARIPLQAVVVGGPVTRG